MLDRKERGCTAGRHADLSADVLHVMVSRLRGDHESISDLLGGEAEGEEPEDLGLAGRETRWERRPRGAPMTRGSLRSGAAPSDHA